MGSLPILAATSRISFVECGENKSWLGWRSVSWLKHATKWWKEPCETESNNEHVSYLPKFNEYFKFQSFQSEDPTVDCLESRRICLFVESNYQRLPTIETLPHFNFWPTSNTNSLEPAPHWHRPAIASHCGVPGCYASSPTPRHGPAPAAPGKKNPEDQIVVVGSLYRICSHKTGSF